MIRLRQYIIFGALFGFGCLHATGAISEDFSPKIEWHGFATWQYARTNQNLFFHGTPDGNYANLDFALNVTAAVNGNLRIVAQPFFSQVHGTENAKLDYAFAEWRFSDLFKLRVGQIKLPFGISSEVFDVGVLRPFLSLPSGIYSPIGFVNESYKGVGFSGRLPVGTEWRLNYDLFGGAAEEEELAYPEDFLRGENVVAMEVIEEETIQDFVGGRLVAETPVEGLSLGIAGMTGKEGSQRATLLGVQGEYSAHGWSVRSEFMLQKAHGRTQTGLYVETAYRFTPHWQVAFQYDRLFINLPGVNVATAPSLKEHEEFAGGINYWFNESFVLKAGYHYIRGNRLSAPAPADLAALVASGGLKNVTHLIEAGTSFSF